MPTVSLNQYIDFLVLSGKPKVEIVRKIKQSGNQPYEPKRDYYKKIRDSIVLYERKQMDEAALLDVSSWNKDKRKTPAFEMKAKNYLNWRSDNPGDFKNTQAYNAEFGELNVRVKPEVSIQVDNKITRLKLYFKKEALPQNRVPLIHGLVKKTFANPNDTSCILDLRRIDETRENVLDPNLDILLNAEAEAFVSIWKNVEKAEFK